MTDSSAPPRPRQVTFAAGLIMVGSVFVVLTVFERIAGLQSLETQQSVEKFLSEPPGDGLGIGVQGVLDDPATAGRTLADPHVGELPVATAIDQFLTSDVFMHAWDLARATGQSHRLDPAKAEELLTGMLPMDEVLRASGEYGPKVEVPADADAEIVAFFFE